MAGEKDVMRGKWNQMKGNVHQWFGKLTDDDLQQIQGDREKLVGKLQERYGWNRMKAEQEVNRRMDEYERENAHTMH